MHTPNSHFLNIHLNIILPSTPGSHKRLFPSGFHTKSLHTPILYPVRATCPSTMLEYTKNYFKSFWEISVFKCRQYPELVTTSCRQT
jgi:hypothetical protein